MALVYVLCRPLYKACVYMYVSVSRCALLCYYCYLGKPVDVNNRRCATGRLLPSGFMFLCIYLLASMEWLRLYNEA